MSNVLSEEKKQQVIALGKLGWSLRRIEQATGVRIRNLFCQLSALERTLQRRRMTRCLTVSQTVAFALG